MLQTPPDTHKPNDPGAPPNGAPGAVPGPRVSAATWVALARIWHACMVLALAAYLAAQSRSGGRMRPADIELPARLLVSLPATWPA